LTSGSFRIVSDTLVKETTLPVIHDKWRLVDDVDACTDYLQPKLSAIPAYMPVTLDVAVGFKYGTDADFQRFGKELQNAVQRFDKLPLTLCNGNVGSTFVWLTV